VFSLQKDPLLHYKRPLSLSFVSHNSFGVFVSVCEFVCELGECGVFAEVVILELELELFWR